MKNEPQRHRSTKKSPVPPRVGEQTARKSAAPTPEERSRAEGEGMIAREPPAGPPPSGLELEGEGSYTAARHYREGVERSVREGHADELGEKAAQALDGPEGKDLRRAERAAKHGHAEHQPPAHGHASHGHGAHGPPKTH